MYIFKIDGTDVSKSILHKSLVITDEVGSAPSTLICKFTDRQSFGIPALEDSVEVTVDGTVVFGGYIIDRIPTRIGSGEVVYKLQCIDQNRILNRQLVVESYEDMTDKAIIEDIVANYCEGSGITTVNVLEGVTVNQIAFNYVQPSQCFKRLAHYAGRNWYIDYSKDIHYFPLETNAAPFNITDASANYKKFKLRESNREIRNRVYVRGGTYLSDEITISMVADGEQTVFHLPDKPHDITMTVGGVPKTIGTKYLHDEADYDYLVSYQEKYVEVASAATPAADTVMAFTYKYDIPVLVAVENTDSIEEVGMFEHAIFDNKINTLDAARDRAQAELTEFAESLESGSFITNTHGFRAGQYQTINLTDYGINDEYLIKKVVARSLGGDLFEYTVSFVNRKGWGIIQFLINLLESYKNALDIGDEEVVDELWQPDAQGVSVQDSCDLITDSPPFQWDDCSWDLFEWS